jgi:hypothetical protein
MSLLKIEKDGGRVLRMYLGGSKLASGPGFGGEVLTASAYNKSRRLHATTPVTIQPRSAHVYKYWLQVWWSLVLWRCRTKAGSKSCLSLPLTPFDPALLY